MIARPLHPYTQALVSVIPVPQGADPPRRQVLTGEIPDPAAIPAGCRFHPRCPLYRIRGEPERCRTADPRLLPDPRMLPDPGPARSGTDNAARSHVAACHFAGSTLEGDPDGGQS